MRRVADASWKRFAKHKVVAARQRLIGDQSVFANQCQIGGLLRLNAATKC